jgi:hypothetical protein
MTVCASAILSVGLCAEAEAYESGTVTDGGTVRGKITFKGPVPEPKEFNCIATQIAHSVGSCRMERDIVS